MKNIPINNVSVCSDIMNVFGYFNQNMAYKIPTNYRDWKLHQIGRVTQLCYVLITFNRAYHLLSGRHYSMEQRHAQLRTHCCPDLMPFMCGYIAEYCKYSRRKNNDEVLKTMRPGGYILGFFFTK